MSLMELPSIVFCSLRDCKRSSNLRGLPGLGFNSFTVSQTVNKPQRAQKCNPFTVYQTVNDTHKGGSRGGLRGDPLQSARL